MTNFYEIKNLATGKVVATARDLRVAEKTALAFRNGQGKPFAVLWRDKVLFTAPTTPAP